MAARQWLRDRMEELGLEHRMDGAGNVIGRFGPEDKPAIVIASHLDSVPAGGIFDGVLGVVAGLGPVPLAAGLTLDGYGQAGVVARDGPEGYADGAVRVSRVVASPGAARIELGLGAWGAAQLGATRLDAGPSASAVVPLGSSGAAVRLSLEWRARLAGNATPTSGPALSIGTDF